MTKRMVIVVIALFIFFGLIFGFNVFRSVMINKYIKNMMQQTATISTAKAEQQVWHPTLRAVGTLIAINGIDVNSEVAGQVVKISFTSGETVKKNTELVQLDDSLDQQNLIMQQAQLHLYQNDYDRKKTLAQRKVISQDELDRSYANLVQSQAAVATAQLNIDKKHIKAPFSGRLGIGQVNIGQYVSPGQALVPLQQLDPLYVDFSLPEQQLKYLKAQQPVELSADVFPNQKFNGTLTAINSKVDPNTRTISARATVPNPQNQLYPGVFTEVTVVLPAQQQVVTVPQTAITYSLHGNTIYVVVNKGKDKEGNPILVAEQRFVTVGERRGSIAVIVSGVNAGEEVVTAGQLKLQPGAPVNINNNIPLNE